MSFREIRPSFGDNSTSNRNLNLSTPESTGPDLRRIRNEHVIPNSNNSSRRRKRPDNITRNACAACKKARSKCDGRQPCGRCALRADAPDCIYTLHTKHAKEELVKEVEELKGKYGLAKSILEALCNDEMAPEILERLKRGEKYEDIIEWLGRTPDDDYETMSPNESQHFPFEALDQEIGGTGSTVSWTTIAPRQPVIDHLFQLYFSWVHPVHTLFDEGRFAQSHNHNLGEYCSSILVNALCAMACHLHRNKHDDEVNFGELSEEFIEAVQAEIHPDDYTLTTVQACGVMFLVDCAEGKGLRGASYLKHALSILPNVPHLDSGGFAEVWATTIHGIRNLSIEWAQIACHDPVASIPLPFEEIARTIAQDNSKWHYYRFMNDDTPYWPSLIATTNRQKSALLAIINDTTTMMYSQFSQPISAIEILKHYHRFMTWRNDLPSVIGDIEGNNSRPLPHVLSLLILYSQSVIQLLRPLLNLVGFPTPLVEEVIWNHAQQGMSLLEYYRTQYTCHYQPVLQLFAVLHFSDVIARFFPTSVDKRSKDGPGAMQFGLDILRDSEAGFPIAGPLQEMLRRTAKECSVLLPISTSDPPNLLFRMDDFLDACTRSTYVQPCEEILGRYLPTVSVEWVSQCSSYGFQEPAVGAQRLTGPLAEERGARNLMDIHNLINGD